MSNDLIGSFPLDRATAYLNHASYGAPTIESLALAETLRAGIERDTALGLGSTLVESLQRIAGVIQQRLALPGGQTAVVPNATESNNALASSLPLPAGSRVALFDSEYSSVIRCWQVHAARQGASVTVLPMALPARRAAILEAVAALDSATRMFVCSAISSTAAIAMPLREISQICQDKGIRLIIDSAHLPGHMDALLADAAPDAVFGSFHKWLPIPRPAGFLWVRDDLVDTLRPATVSLTWDAPTLVERFSWWGTWDPAACLTVPHGFDAMDAWRRSGHIAAAEQVAATLSDDLVGLGLVPTAEPALTPSRLRAFLVPGVTPEALKAEVYAAGVRAWIGSSPTNRCVLRISTNVYNDTDDATRLLGSVARAARSRTDGF